MSSISLYGYITVGLSILQLKDTWEHILYTECYSQPYRAYGYNSTLGSTYSIALVLSSSMVVDERYKDEIAVSASYSLQLKWEYKLEDNYNIKSLQ